MSAQLDTAILFLVFNRPETTSQVFEAIREAKPLRLYVAADGARDGREGELEKVEAVRKIATNVDWPCEVKTLFRDENFGCRRAVSEAIDWFFENEEQGIVLEDDCLPSQSFFRFCDELLLKYIDTEEVMQICGFNPFDCDSWSYSYDFSRFGPIWGWASWRRAWQKYDVHMNSWPQYRLLLTAHELVKSEAENSWRVGLFDKVHKGEIDTWDYQWAYAKMIDNGLSILPSRSLIANIGFTSEATHTKSKAPEHVLIKHEICFPLEHNENVKENLEYGRNYFEKFAIGGQMKNGVLTRLFRKLTRVVRGEVKQIV